MRIRTLSLPNGRFVLVLDRCDLGPEAFGHSQDLLRRTGAAAIIVDADEIDLDGDPTGWTPEMVEALTSASS